MIEAPPNETDLETEDAVALPLVDRIWFDDTRYWMVNGAGDEWVSMNLQSLKLALKHLEVRPYLTKAEVAAGELMSPMDKLIHAVEMKGRIAWAGPLAGRPAGVYRMSGQLVLVTVSPVLIPPRVSDPLDDGVPRIDYAALPYARPSDAVVGECVGWPLLGLLWRNLFTCLREADTKADVGAEDYDQLIYWYAWLKRGLKSLYEAKREDGHGVLLAGEPGCGKTLTVWILHQLFGGRLARPLAWIEGRTQFNSSMFKAPLLVVDDEGSKTRIADRKQLGANYKQIVAVQAGEMEAKGKDRLELECFWRLLFCTNLEEQNLVVFPPLDNDIADKVMLFKAYSNGFPWPQAWSKQEIQDALRPELPYFLHWLLYEFELPDGMYSQRFGLKNWMHPEIVDKLEFLSPEVRLWNQIERSVLRAENYWNDEPLPRGVWMGSVSDLEAALRDPDGPLSFRERENIPPANPTMGKYLGKLATMRRYEGQIRQERDRKHGRAWVLKSNDYLLSEQGDVATETTDINENGENKEVLF